MPLSFAFRVLAWLSERTSTPIARADLTKARAATRRSANTFEFIVGREVELDEISNERINDIAVRRYRPHGAPTGQAIVYFHGGGWVTGDLDSHDRPCRVLADRSGVEVIAVDYRLAPENPFPAAVTDALAVAREVLKTNRVVVAGDSAGGHLAAVCARHLDVAGQLLIYPITDCLNETLSYERYATGHFLTRETMRFFKRSFVTPSQASHADASPLRAPPMKTCPAYVLLAECDVLVDEGRAYAKKLEDEGSSVTVDELPGAIHGFFSMQGLSVSRAATERAAQWARLQLRR